MNIPPPSIVAASPVTLPEEFIGEVLSYLTVKSLMRMKCVNKSWNTLISNPIFVKLHLMRSPRNTHFVLYSSELASANILPISVSHLLKSGKKTVTLTNDPYCRFHSKDLRGVDCFPVVLVDYPDCLVQHDGVYFSNSIGWLVHHQYNCHLKNLTIKEYVIVSLDLGTQTYSQLLLPRYCNNEMPLDPTPTLFVFMDCLYFSYDFEKTYFVIWQMKEFGVEESWTQLLKISYLDLNISISDLEYGMRLFPLCFSDDDALILANNFGYDPTLYNWRNNRAKRIQITKFGDETIRYDWYYAKEYYVESLVSTC